MNINLIRYKATLIILSCSVLFAYSSSVYADKDRQKVIDFDGDLVEGVNKKPLDSLTQVSEKDKHRKNNHLYQKRRGFRTETQETLREMRYAE